MAAIVPVGPASVYPLRGSWIGGGIRFYFRVSIAGLMTLVLTASLCLAALRYPRVAVCVVLVLISLHLLMMLALSIGGVSC